MENQIERSWWAAQDVMNRLRLSLLRNRNAAPIKDKLTQAEFSLRLYEVLEQSSMALTRAHAVQQVQAWLNHKESPASPFLLAQLQDHLLPLLQNDPSRSPRTPQPSPRTPRFRTSSSAPRADRAPSTPRYSPSVDSPWRGAPSRTPSTSLPQRCSMSNPSLAATESQSTWSTFRHLAQSTRDSAEVRPPHQKLQASVRVPDSMDGIVGPSRAQRTLHQRVMQEKPEKVAWWVSQSILDSVRLRLERSPHHEPIRGLLQYESFFPALESILSTGNEMSSLKEALFYVESQLELLRKSTSSGQAIEQLWEMLQPLLTLRKRVSDSQTAMPIPLQRLREIERQEEETRLLRAASASQNSKPEDSEEPWDWETVDPAMQDVVASAVNHIASPSHSHTSLPAYKPNQKV